MKCIVGRRVPLTAMSADEVAELLCKLNLYDDVVNGKARCFICGRRITLDNIGGVLMVAGKPVLVCDRPSCIARAALLSKEKQQVAVASR